MIKSETYVLDAARTCGASGRYETALLLLDLLKDDTVCLRDALLLRGRILAQQGRYADAIGALERLLAKWPEDGEAQSCLRRAKQRQASPSAYSGRHFRIAALVVVSLCLLSLLSVSFAVGRRMTDQEVSQREALLRELYSDLQGAVDVAVERSTSARQADRIGALLKETQNRLDALRFDMAKEQTAAQVVSATRDLQAVTSNEWVQLSCHLREIGSSLNAFRAEQKQIVERQLAENNKVASLSQTVVALRSELTAIREEGGAFRSELTAIKEQGGALRSELSAVREQSAQERAGAEHTLRLTVASLRPVNMDRLDRRIKEVEEVLVAARNREIELRNENNLLDSIRHGRAEKMIRDMEPELLSLREQWEAQVLPWLRVNDALKNPNLLTNGVPIGGLSDTRVGKQFGGNQNNPTDCTKSNAFGHCEMMFQNQNGAPYEPLLQNIPSMINK